MAVIVGFNQKGGSGKTTLVGNLAGEFHAQGLTVAAIDLDPQGSLAEWAQAGEGLLAQVTMAIPGLHDLPEGRRAAKVTSVLSEATDLADIVLVDTPPLLAGVSLAALEHADLALIPVKPTPKDIRASAKAIAEVQAVKGLKAALAPFMVSSRGNFSRELPEVLTDYGLPVLPGIRQLTVVAECDTVGLTMYEYKPTSPARLEFSELAAECNRLLRNKRKTAKRG